MSQQICKVCLRPDCFDFHLPDWLWQSIVPKRFWNKVVCLCCLDRFAAEQKIDYTNYLKHLYFAGRQGSFEFRVAPASP